ncbi:tRNA (guanine(9)-N1)-methyltransferase [Penicillium diatomitis]|uniref:tRNA (guanine(9)-N1)-methyltransferase n=1 Tax=Penicillium diatomitis TaxID=2819901 RepID=A0A9W9WTY8_9EURO|nr:tRNA (guanine(9)-N1)-methyltransferase [Penicillium diatomitis]KAJ5475491.1 tRNA (guanine(9)-N1)-methyltransferase [Penicillium diatomitis]
MDERERPRKLPKLDHNNALIQHELSRTMTGPVPAADNLSQATASTPQLQQAQSLPSADETADLFAQSDEKNNLSQAAASTAQLQPAQSLPSVDETANLSAQSDEKNNLSQAAASTAQLQQAQSLPSVDEIADLPTNSENRKNIAQATASTTQLQQAQSLPSADETADLFAQSDEKNNLSQAAASTAQLQPAQSLPSVDETANLSAQSDEKNNLSQAAASTAQLQQAQSLSSVDETANLSTQSDEKNHQAQTPVGTSQLQQVKSLPSAEETVNLPTQSEEKKSLVAQSEAPTEENKDGTAPKLSKNQLKKLRKKQQWEAERGLRKEKRKAQMAQKKQRRQRMVEEARETGGEEAVKALRKQWETTRAQAKRSTLLPLSIVIDCGFDDLMNDHERISLAGQLTRSYSDNKRSKWRTHLMFSSFNKQLKHRFDTVLAPYRNWQGIRIVQDDFVRGAEILKNQMASPQGGKLVGPFADQVDAKPEDGEVIYLSSDSDNILTELKPYSTYIIGGLVDKNRHKAVCYRSAISQGVKTAKLPIGEYVEMSSRQVLTTNHVVDIMLKWLEVKDWGEAFMKVLPPRKGGQLKGWRNSMGAVGEPIEKIVLEVSENEDEQEESLEDIANQMEADAEGDADEDHDNGLEHAGTHA